MSHGEGGREGKREGGREGEGKGGGEREERGDITFEHLIFPSLLCSLIPMISPHTHQNLHSSFCIQMIESRHGTGDEAIAIVFCCCERTHNVSMCQ